VYTSCVPRLRIALLMIFQLLIYIKKKTAVENFKLMLESYREPSNCLLNLVVSSLLAKLV
jgi:hypothetical protein